MQNTSLNLLFEKKLSEAGLRITSTRRQIFDVLLRANRPMEVLEITRQVNGSHFVSVYRSVDALIGAGLLKQVPFGFKNRVELNDDFKPHHHHATCEACGKVTEISDKNIEKMINSVSSDIGFKTQKHHFEIYGLCRACDKATVAKQR